MQTAVSTSPQTIEKCRPIETIRLMLPVSRLPQYWAARIKIAPSMPPENIWRKVWICPPI